MTAIIDEILITKKTSHIRKAYLQAQSDACMRAVCEHACMFEFTDKEDSPYVLCPGCPSTVPPGAVPGHHASLLHGSEYDIHRGHSHGAHWRGLCHYSSSKVKGGGRWMQREHAVAVAVAGTCGVSFESCCCAGGSGCSGSMQ